MALFPPEFLAGMLLAFLQLRLRAHLGLASRLLSGLRFLLPPDDALLAALNAKPPLSAADKLATFYLRSATTDAASLSQTLFFELFEMLVVVVTSALGGCALGDLAALVLPAADAGAAAGPSVYGPLSALLVSLWFPLQLQRAQGLASYEARLALAAGAGAFVAAAFAIAAPRGLLDVDVEGAADLAGRRLALALRAFGFVDADFARLAPAATAARWAFLSLLALVAAAAAGALVLPAFRFARTYAAVTRRGADASSSRLERLLLHLNMWSPLLLAALWVPALARAPLVDRLALLSAAQFRRLRLLLVLLAAALRALGLRHHLQFFLLEPRDAMAAAVAASGRGPVDGAALQRAARLQFNYAPVVALQFLAPAGALAAAAVLLLRQELSPAAAMDAAALAARPDLGGFRMGDELTRESAAKVLRGMAAFPLLLPEFYASALGFLAWFLSAATLAASLGGLVYWRRVAHEAAGPVAAAPVAADARKSARKNAKKALKFKKH